ncbi:phage N-6-adenine-methyltransferase [Endozoicomonas sp. G2_1]|uniref:phage N-6-adenine-methyltransferase n=1 Tax=Endozoicomonas sp. G2_1 TaxID=2821091 RepID=UPI001ADD4477|nr:phage N-6-adenine-methyltransferase [Endozoicomonas sp. G2_1]MBO9492131.1 phage N-6-adenine-methyltransferase [Endozoicomonas sp. G2_1]
MMDYDKNSWSTPRYIFDAMAKEFDFVLDAAASADNHKCPLFLTKEMDALNVNWRTYVGNTDSNNQAVWLNPPYGKGEIAPFVDKALRESVFNNFTVVMLVPATPDARWWPAQCSEKRFITEGRVSFVHPETGKPINGNTKGSAFLIFRPLSNSQNLITEVSRETLQFLAANELAGANGNAA